MPTLFQYAERLRTRLADQKMEVFDEGDLWNYINTARREIAMRSQCLRVLTPISGSVKQVTVTSPGSGYTNPTISITPPDFPPGIAPYPNGRQAVLSGETWNGQLNTVNVIDGGAGYYQPIITITDPTGSGAEVSITLSPFNTLILGQEVYPFSSIDLSAFPGYGEIYMVKSVSLIYANYRYSLPFYDFSTYQALIRQYPFQYQYVPTVFSQYGQGAAGSLYMYPLPSQNYQCELDCFCWPQDLIDDQSVEALPDPWTEAVTYFAAFLAYQSIQNYNFARVQYELYEAQLNRYSVAARPGRATSKYGRYIWPFVVGIGSALMAAGGLT